MNRCLKYLISGSFGVTDMHLLLLTFSLKNGLGTLGWDDFKHPNS